MKVILGVGFLAIVLTLIIGPGIYGAILAFRASIILGVLALIIEPSPTVLGWVAILGRADVCDRVAAWLHLPF